MRVEYKTNTISPYEVQKLLRTKTRSQIAEHYGISLEGLAKWGRRHNVDLSRITDWEVAEGIGTKTPKELASEYNVTTGVIYYRLSKMGICPKQPCQRGGKQ